MEQHPEGNFNLILGENMEDLQEIVDFDTEFDEIMQVSSLPDYADFLNALDGSEFPDIPPPETPAAARSTVVSDEPKNKRFRSVSEETLKQYQSMNQSSSTKRNTKWGLKILQDWHKEQVGSEMDIHNIPVDQLADKLGKFYCEAKPQTQDPTSEETLPHGHGHEYHKNTLLNIRGAINRHLNDIGRNVDIVNDREFKTANSQLNGLLKERVATGTSRPTKHKDVMTVQDMQTISAYLANANENPIKLRIAVWFNLSIHFVTRGLEFHYQLGRNSFQFKTDENGNEYACLSHETQQKNYQGGLSCNENFADKRMYATGTPSCPVKMLKSFLDKTDPNASKLFNQCNKDAITDRKTNEIWYTNKPLGKYSFRNFLPDLCKQAGCMRYTSHCLRATAIQSMSDSGFETRQIMYMSGHRNESSVRSYSRDCSTLQKQSLSSVLSATAHGVEKSTTATVGLPCLPPSTSSSLVTTTGNIQPPALGDVTNTMAAIQSGILTNSTFNQCSFNFNMKMQ